MSRCITKGGVVFIFVVVAVVADVDGASTVVTALNL